MIKDLSENLVNSKEQIFEYLQNGNSKCFSTSVLIIIEFYMGVNFSHVLGISV